MGSVMMMMVGTALTVELRRHRPNGKVSSYRVRNSQQLSHCAVVHLFAVFQLMSANSSGPKSLCEN